MKAIILYANKCFLKVNVTYPLTQCSPTIVQWNSIYLWVSIIL